MATAKALDPAADRELARRKPVSIWRDTLGHVVRQRSAQVGLLLLGLLVLAAILAPFVAPYAPERPALLGSPEPLGCAPPCLHLLGCAADKPRVS